jgi:hypothetical protein
VSQAAISRLTAPRTRSPVSYVVDDNRIVAEIDDEIGRYAFAPRGSIGRPGSWGTIHENCNLAARSGISWLRF